MNNNKKTDEKPKTNFEQTKITLNYDITEKQAEDVLNLIDPDAPRPAIEDINQISLSIYNEKAWKDLEGNGDGR